MLTVALLAGGRDVDNAYYMVDVQDRKISIFRRESHRSNAHFVRHRQVCLEELVQGELNSGDLVALPEFLGFQQELLEKVLI